MFKLNKDDVCSMQTFGLVEVILEFDQNCNYETLKFDNNNLLKSNDFEKFFKFFEQRLKSEHEKCFEYRDSNLS